MVHLPLAPSRGAAHCWANTHLLTGHVSPVPRGMSLRGPSRLTLPSLSPSRHESQPRGIRVNLPFYLTFPTGVIGLAP